ncbi:MAG: MBL fold metallo-hydrolase [Candidatus Omnitrophica bacterium]|nr:MBL fold metallo-hydrolase [Candidatus Omnitrophota bacterium]
MIFETVVVGPMQVNCYVLASEPNSKCIIIDPGAEERKIRKVMEKHKLIPECVINTHGHFDHIGCDDAFGVPVYVHEKDLPMLEEPKLNMSGFFSLPYRVSSSIRVLQDKDRIKTQSLELEVIHVPGHTRGGIALLVKKPESDILITGDSLFYQGIGRSDLEGGDEGQLIRSIREKLISLPDETKVYPGHGPSSTIGQERLSNPYLGQ